MTRAAAIARRIGVAVLAVGALLVAGSLLALIQQGPSFAVPTPEFTIAEDLEPGTPESRSGSFVLERDSALVAFAWLERTGILIDATLAIEVCDSAATCLDPTTLTSGVHMVAGPVVVTVTTVLADTAAPGSSGSVIGQLTFVADEDLAGTGVDPLPWLAAGAAAVAGGVLMVAVIERRRWRRSD